MEDREIVLTFYQAWINKDIDTLKVIYDKDCLFNDPGFKNLDYKNTIKMWTMWFKRGKNNKLNAKYEILEVRDGQVKTISTLKYNFGKHQNPVINKINSVFTIKNNKIINQLDKFDFKIWYNQAFNIKKNKHQYFYKLMQKLAQIKAKRMLKKII